MRMYVFFVASLLFDLATSILCFQPGGLAKTNLLYRMWAWAFPSYSSCVGGKSSYNNELAGVFLLLGESRLRR